MAAVVLAVGWTPTADAQLLQRRTTRTPGPVVQPTVRSTGPAPPAAVGVAASAPGASPSDGSSFGAAAAARPQPPARRPLTAEEQRYPRPVEVAAELRGQPRGGTIQRIPEMLESIGQSARTCFDAARAQSPGLEVSASFDVKLRQGGLIEEVTAPAPTVRTRHGHEVVAPGPDAPPAANALLECITTALRSVGFQNQARSQFDLLVRMETRDLTQGERALADGRACIRSRDWACLETALRNAGRDRTLATEVSELKELAQSELTTALGLAVGEAEVAADATSRADRLRAALETSRRYRAITGSASSPPEGALQARLRETEREVAAEEARARREARAEQRHQEELEREQRREERQERREERRTREIESGHRSRARGGRTPYQCFTRCVGTRGDDAVSALTCCRECRGRYGCNGVTSCCNP